MLRKYLIIFALNFLLRTCLVSTAYSDDLTHTIGIGSGYPYFSLKYGLSPRWSFELRGAFGSGISVYGARLYHNLNPEKRTVIYFGGEVDYVGFDVDEVAGNGFIGLVFVGGEHFITKKLTLNLDIGPVYTNLMDTDSDISVSGMDWVVNIGVNFYFKRF